MSKAIANVLSAVFARIATAVAVVLPAVTSAHAQVISDSCAPEAVIYVVSNNGNTSTMSTSFVNVDDAAVTFKQGGTAPNCVLVSFSGAAASKPSTTMFVRATIDGHTVASPAQLQFFYNSTSGTLYFESRAGNFVFPSVAPGRHRIRMQFLSGDGGFVQFTNTTLIVRYAR